MKFQGLVEGSWTDLAEVDSTVHIGWNSFDFDASNTKVEQFRISGSKGSACEVGEIKVTGIKIYDDDSDSVTCSASLTIGDQ